MESLDARFWSKVRKSNGCWEWTACRGSGRGKPGYGQFWDGSRLVQAHRYAYERERGVIPEGLQIDHLCRNKACVNPAHLDVVTAQENTRRAAPFMKRDVCKNGHPLSGDNLRIDRGHKVCIACARKRTKEYSMNKRAKRRNTASTNTNALRARIRDLERERDRLRAQLTAAAEKAGSEP